MTTVATSVNLPQPPGAAARCRDCGQRLIACYSGQQYHPTCDPDPPGWTDEQLAEWGARVDQRRREGGRTPDGTQ